MINNWFNKNMNSQDLFGGITEDSNIENIFVPSVKSQANNLLSIKIDKSEKTDKQNLNSSKSILSSHKR